MWTIGILLRTLIPQLFMYLEKFIETGPNKDEVWLKIIPVQNAQGNCWMDWWPVSLPLCIFRGDDHVLKASTRLVDSISGWEEQKTYWTDILPKVRNKINLPKPTCNYLPALWLLLLIGILALNIALDSGKNTRIEQCFASVLMLLSLSIRSWLSKDDRSWEIKHYY